MNIDSTDSVFRQKDEHMKAGVPCTEVNKFSLVQIKTSHKKFTHQSPKELKKELAGRVDFTHS